MWHNGYRSHVYVIQQLYTKGEFQQHKERLDRLENLMQRSKVCASWWAHIKCAKHFIGQWPCQS